MKSEKRKVKNEESITRQPDGESPCNSAQEWYQRGNEYRRQQQWHDAINCYIEAIRLDPDSPAVEAKKMLDDIMNFYCKDMYNP